MSKIGAKDILMVVAIVLITLMVSSLFRKSPPNEKLIRAEMKIEQLEEKRKYDSLLLVEQLKAKDLVIAALQDRDTVIIRNINSSNDKIKNIPAAVRNLSNEELRRAVANYNND